VSRLAFGTGTHGSRLQRRLGQEEVTRFVQYAYNRGICFFEIAESYPGMPEMLSIAQGHPAGSKIDRFRAQLNNEHIDILLLHACARRLGQPIVQNLQDGFPEAKAK
jgi:hypothetical protein